jgi:hypothetical protein
MNPGGYDREASQGNEEDIYLFTGDIQHDGRVGFYGEKQFEYPNENSHDLVDLHNASHIYCQPVFHECEAADSTARKPYFVLVYLRVSGIIGHGNSCFLVAQKMVNIPM